MHRYGKSALACRAEAYSGRSSESMVGRLDVVTAFGFGVRAWVHKKVHKKESFGAQKGVIPYISI